MEFMSQIFFFLVLVPSAILHEYMHGFVADKLGDPTARYAGRLTLDPRVHIDPIGSILLPLGLFLMSGGKFMFAYAKPVPYNAYNLKNQKWGPVAVAVAGPLSNFLLAFIFGLLIQFLPLSSLSSSLSLIVYANVLLGVFNLVPIPPLDGSKVLLAVLPDSMHSVRVLLEKYGFVLLILFMLFFYQFLTPLIGFLFELFTGGAVSF